MHHTRSHITLVDWVALQMLVWDAQQVCDCHHTVHRWIVMTAPPLQQVSQQLEVAFSQELVSLAGGAPVPRGLRPCPGGAGRL